MARLLSKSCFLALIVVLVFVTLAAFFESIPRNPYYGTEAVLNPLKGESLNGAVEQSPALAAAPPFSVKDDPPAQENQAPLTPEEQEKKKIEDEKKRKEEEMKRKEDERRKKEKAEAELRKKKGPAKFKKINTFAVPDDIVYDPAGPRPDQIVILSASDGKGHNGGIPNLLEQTKVNRQEYADLHGYTYHFLNISKYDYGGAHPVWAKLPAIVETFNTFPDVQWVWWLDLDAIIMTPSVKLSSLLSHEAIDKNMQKNTEIKKGGGGLTGVFTLEKPNVKKMDLIFSQDMNGINAGSFFIRRSEFTRWFLDMWADPFFMERDWPGQEQDAVMHLVREHPIMLEHLALYPQQIINAYPVDIPDMGWRKGDLVVHLAGCWVEEVCDVRWRQYQRKKTPVKGGSDSPPTEDLDEEEVKSEQSAS